MGGFSSERHISVESGRNVYTKLAASGRYVPIPLFLSGTKEQHRIFILPISLLLKDNADDIHGLLLDPIKLKALKAPLDKIRVKANDLVKAYAQGAIQEPQELSYETLKEKVDFLFLALHGRPGEDGTIQTILEKYDLPYNGSGIRATALTIDKYATNQFLAQHGFYTPKQLKIRPEEYDKADSWIDTAEQTLSYPMIAKPVDDGCSTGVIKVNNRSMLLDYAKGSIGKEFLVESYITQQPTDNCFLEITTGLLTHIQPNNQIRYEIFEPSQVLSIDAILSLEEKFLAGEGHNITPARFHVDTERARSISKMVQRTLKNVAAILNLQGYARIDAFVQIDIHESVKVWIIEVNALPAMTPATCLFHQCAFNGYKPFDFIEAIIQYGFTKNNFDRSIKRPLQ